MDISRVTRRKAEVPYAITVNGPSARFGRSLDLTIAELDPAYRPCSPSRMAAFRLLLLPALCCAIISCSPPGQSRDGLDGGLDGGQDGLDGGATLLQGWNPKKEIGIPRDSFSVEIAPVDVDVNAGGVGVAVWREFGDYSNEVWLAWFRGNVWEAPTQISTAGTVAFGGSVALNDAGQAVVAWSVKQIGTGGIVEHETVWARVWKDGTWTAAQRLSTQPSSPQTLYARSPQVGIDAAGRAWVVWDQWESSTPSTIQASRFDGATWSDPVPVSTGDRSAQEAHVAVSSGGSAVVVWIQQKYLYDPGGGPTSSAAWARTHNGTSWDIARRIGDDLADYNGSERPHVVIDATGRAFAAWEEFRTPPSWRIAAARFTPDGTGWAAPEPLAIGASTEHQDFLSIATDGQGGALVVWQRESSITSSYLGGATRYTVMDGWVSSMFESQGDVAQPQAAMDGAGNAWVFYRRTPGGLYARRLTTSIGWSSAEWLGGGDATDLAANSTGLLIAGSVFLNSAAANVYRP